MISADDIISNTVKDNRYADIPIPNLEDIILNGNDEVIYYCQQTMLHL